MKVRRRFRSTLAWALYTALAAVVGLVAVAVVKPGDRTVAGVQSQGDPVGSLAALGQGSVGQTPSTSIAGLQPRAAAYPPLTSGGHQPGLSIPVGRPQSRASYPSSPPRSSPSPTSTSTSSPGSHQSPTPTPTPSSTTPVRSPNQTFTLSGGTRIQASCAGTTLATEVILSTGWTVDESSKSTGTLHLHILQTGGDGEVEVVVGCQSGSPVLW